MHALIRKSFAIVFALALSGVANAGEWHYNDVSRVVAIADIHGAYGAMVKTLSNAGLLDARLSWVGGDAHLVIVGDLLDRGPDSRKAMDLLMQLEGEAGAAGGKVHVLIGNHEAMNLVGDLRYVSQSEYAAFADEETANERDRWFTAWVAAGRAPDDEPAAQRDIFEQRFPPGFFAHRRAFGTYGKYGEWLLSKPVIVVVNGTAFVHGGLSPSVVTLGLDGVNGQLVDEMREYVAQIERLIEAGEILPTDSFYNHPQLLAGFMPGPETSAETVTAVEAIIRLNDSDLHSIEGPLWYRGNVACSRVIEEGRLARSLAAIGAERVVIGHTPTPGRQVFQRLGGQVVEIDTGMLNNYYEGRGHALIIDGDAISVVSENSTEVMTVARHPRRVGARPGGAMSASELEQLLAHGEIIADKTDELGRRVVSVGDGTRI
ncbi:MAG: metallophosphoesterase, partial [Woeseiaceae bacterium]